ncbi:sister chromatid cohesion protein PDS5 homolog B-like [Ptychodera flava]|uniref:sister chromatid cohesion protein PDS5 homolog B-like n=1 Tax=Ptychodera flava TaxID=63121 RepID=UPI00396A2913
MTQGRDIVYPPGVKEISPNLSKDELIKRLKTLARFFQDMDQEEEKDQYEPLALYLVDEFFLSHASKDVRLLVACCLADIFRVFAPEAPYKSAEELKNIFQFLTKQLRGLDNTNGPFWKRYFYLLENLAMVKSYNICMELEDSSEIFTDLFRTFFTIINDSHSPKVKNFMLDVMCPLIMENDSVAQDLLDAILINLVDPHKRDNPNAYNLCTDLIKRTAVALEPFLQGFFNNMLILGRTSESDVSGHLYELVYELNMISNSVLLSVLPQLELKLKTNDENERLAVTKLLGKMFSDRDSDLAMQNKPLWNCFLGRFADVSIPIRTECVKYAQYFILYHHGLFSDIKERLKERLHDIDENVRHEAVSAIVSAAKKDVTAVSNELLDLVKERMLDKRWKIRKEATLGLAHIYKKAVNNPDLASSDINRVTWIRDKILHIYYQQLLEDKLLVERIFTMTLVPYNLETSDRMLKLYQLYSAIDEHSVRAVNEMLKNQHTVRIFVRELVTLIKGGNNSEETAKAIGSKVLGIARCLPDSFKAQEHMKKLAEILADDNHIRNQMDVIVSPACSCKKAEQAVKQIMMKIGNPKQVTPFYESVKTLLERIAPLMIDSMAVSALCKLVQDQIEGVGEDFDDVSEEDTVANRGMKLLLALSGTSPGSFRSEESYGHLISLLRKEDISVSDNALQIFTNAGKGIEESHPQIASCLLPVLQSKARTGTPREAKHSIHCISAIIVKKRRTIFEQIFESLKKGLTPESRTIHTALTSIGHLAMVSSAQFLIPMKSLVAKFIVKDILMQDRGTPLKTKRLWCADDDVSEETNVKIRAMKLLVRWLIGLRSNDQGSGTSTVRLLTTMIRNDGDLMEKGKVSPAEKSRLRLAAGCALLKLAQEPCYADIITLEQFYLIALLVNDECYQVRQRFAIKLHKGLLSLKLPLQYLSIFALCAKDPIKDRKTFARQCLVKNITFRKDYLRQHSGASSHLMSILPEHVIPYTIHLLAHDPDLQSHRDISGLNDIKECLWFMLEPLITKNESYNFAKKMVETIKQSKDAMAPNDKTTNRKLYAVCDLAYGLIMTKAANFTLKDHPTEPQLPAKLFTKLDKGHPNTDIFLPKELQFKVHVQMKTSDTVLEPKSKKKAAKETHDKNASTSTSKDEKKASKDEKKDENKKKDTPNAHAKPVKKIVKPKTDKNVDKKKVLTPQKQERTLRSPGKDQNATRTSKRFKSPSTEDIVERKKLKLQNLGDSAKNEKVRTPQKETKNKLKDKAAKSDKTKQNSSTPSKVDRKRKAEHSADSEVSSPAKKTKGSPRRATRLSGKNKEDVAPSPSPKSPASSPRKQSPRKPAPKAQGQKKNVRNVRRSSSVTVNGHSQSDGEESSPTEEEQTPRRSSRRNIALEKAIETVGKTKTNIKSTSAPATARRTTRKRKT